ncbi:uncharacterized protein LOC122036466 [Zingiber officinale]|uniref:Uncharacterized protein n=1 Tax=Zingiber officinale TaxID=94328 RepID=A0A8J5E870_ZINOF|nr:uncharacterized protein LOC122036466 [Zingiber officinale]XP_042451720.1 uncharacterized protein LOC122036466 [Zingiber officinale]KAG6466319.1 hypothetical protein ZIOFF_075929 [Zingiber officinale]
MDTTLVPFVATSDATLVLPEKGNDCPPLKPKKKSMTSFYQNFFEIAPDGKSRRCKICKQSYSITTATGNLSRHLRHRHPGYDRLSDGIQQVQRAVISPKKSHPQLKLAIDLDHLNWLLLRWLIEASVPVTFDEVFLNSFRFLNPSVKIWPKDKFQAVALEVFRSMREDVRASLQNINSKASITMDFWTSFEQIFYMSVKCHWIDENWSLHKILLDVCRIPYPCTGPEILSAMTKVLTTFNIDRKILCCTNDNSQQAIHACRALKEDLDAHNLPFFYIPCAARTLNSIIEDGLRTPKPIISKIRDFVLELNSYPDMIEDFKQFLALYHEGSWKFPLDSSTSWSGDYAMLDMVRKAPNAMESTIKKHEETFSGRNLLLSTTEKSAINILHSYLEPFYKITTNLSTSKVPTVGLALFFMDHVFELIGSCRDSCRQEWLKIVADDMAKRVRSFCTQAHNTFTFTAAILDPRIKKELVPENLNLEKHLEEARSYFMRYYPSSQFPATTNGFGSQEILDEDNIVSFAEEIARKRRRASMHSTADELSQFLSEPTLPLATDVLNWWKMNSMRYPRLSVMARDFLAVQGASAEPDELFTSKGDDARKKQFSLSYSNMQPFMCVNSWLQSGYKFKFQQLEINFEKLVESTAASVDIAKT